MGATFSTERLATIALAAADADQLLQAVATGARARVALAAGAVDTAVEHAQAAVEIAARGDASAIHADALIEFAEALEADGDVRGARDATAAALRLYDDKGHLVGVASAQRLAGRLTAARVVE